ncbi:MAG: large-conductance mechanosensitive channel protein MscL [Phycisphaeraceae bacterium]
MGMGLIREFKAFAVRGNVVDMAVGIVIGTAFGKIVNSLVSDVIMPPLGVVTRGMDFSSWSIVLQHADPETNTPEVMLQLGVFLDHVANFIVVAAAMFAVVKVMNRVKMKEEKAPTVTPPKQEVLLEEIRDILKESRA